MGVFVNQNKWCGGEWNVNGSGCSGRKWVGGDSGREGKVEGSKGMLAGGRGVGRKFRTSIKSIFWKLHEVCAIIV